MHINMIFRKRELLLKQDREELNEDEIEELERLTKAVSEATEEAKKLMEAGLKIKMGDGKESATGAAANSDKPKLTVSERRELATKLIAERKEKGWKDKEIIKDVSTELGTSTTYVYNLLKK